MRRTEVPEVSGSENTGGIYRQYTSVRTVPNTPLESRPIDVLTGVRHDVPTSPTAVPTVLVRTISTDVRFTPCCTYVTTAHSVYVQHAYI